MLDTWLIEAENAYRRPLSIKEEIYLPEDKPIDREDWTEHYLRKGDPSKPTYYIIRGFSHTGLLARYKIHAGHIRYALSKGWLPVVDMQNFPNEYLDPEKLGKENAWEYFFEQPLRIGLEQAYNGENIILSERIVRPVLREDLELFKNQNGVLTEWKMLVKMGLLKIKDEIIKEALEQWKKLFAQTDRVLGVHLRGTDYVTRRPGNHYIQPPLEYARDIIIKNFLAWKCNKIFLATEDKNIVQFFKDTFGDGFDDFFVMFDKDYVNYETGSFPSILSDRENDRFLRAKEYLIEMLLLSMCNSFTTGLCSGSAVVMVLKENSFENVHVFDLGKYGLRHIDLRKLIKQ